MWKDLQSLTTGEAAGVAAAGGLGLLLLWRSGLGEKLKELSGGMDDKLDNTRNLAVSVVTELSKVGVMASIADIKTLLDFAFTAASGKPINDRDLAMEKVMAIVTRLPEGSKARRKLTDILVTGLWDSLEHPPISYNGKQYEYRTADGSYNNILIPQLGQAGTPYAKSIIPQQPQQSQKPDPAALFDSLMKRTPESYRENEAGLSVMLFYHATIIIHDIFRTNRYNPTISDTSSYVDLAPLYGSSISDNAKVRSFQNGLLKPDTFFEERLLAQPPGINVMLVLYNRFHNYVADMLLKINENGRFSLKPGDREAALKEQDEALFQTARLVTGGLFAQIALHDYLRGLTNTHHSDSSWTMDPRFKIKGLKGEVERGKGNQVTTEFNLMYRFHSAISQRDEKWLEDFFEGDLGIQDVETATPRDLLLALQKFENATPEDPSQRVFGGLKRGADGRFSDAELVDLLKTSIEDPAAAFGPRNVPKALRVVEIIGIKRAREWQTASLNEFRAFFGLTRHDSFEDINPNPEIADLLRAFYNNPDMVEGYPGMWLEDSKPAMNPGSGVCLPWTVGRAVFSDAITLVRSDRFYTVDFTPATLTSWGLGEITQDYGTLGGSMYYKLIQRGLPGWFPFNSLHVMQPFFTWKTNKKIAEEFGTINDYTLAGPSPPPNPRIVVRYWAARKILTDIENFAVPGLKGFVNMGDGRDYSDFMLSSDAPRCLAQRQLLDSLVYRAPDFGRLVFTTTFKLADDLVKSQMLYCGKLNGEDRFQIDIVKDLAIPVLTRILADIFSLDLKTEENPEGTYDTTLLYEDLLASWTWLFSNIDPAKAWNRRKRAREANERMRASTLTYLKRHLADPKAAKMGFVHRIVHKLFHWEGLQGSHIRNGSLRWYGLQVAQHCAAATGSLEKAAEMLYISSVGGGGLPIGQYGECMTYLTSFDKGIPAYYKALTALSLSNNEESDEKIEGYMLEAFRLSNGLKIVRIAKNNITVDGVKYNPGDYIVMPVGINGTSADPEGFPDPFAFNVERPKDSYLLFGYGAHECFGKEISNKFVAAMLKVSAGFQKLQLVENSLRKIPSQGTSMYLTADGSELTVHPSTAKITFGWYTRDIQKIAAPLYPVLSIEEIQSSKTQAGADEVKASTTLHDRDMALRPCDIAAEMLHIDEGGHAYGEEERNILNANGPNHDPDHHHHSETTVKQANGGVRPGHLSHILQEHAESLGSMDAQSTNSTTSNEFYVVQSGTK